MHAARLLGSYATFRARTREDDVPGTHELFRRAVEAVAAAGPAAAAAAGGCGGAVLASAANFASGVLGEKDEADALYRRAVDLAPGSPDVLGAYAAFVAEVREDDMTVPAICKAVGP